MNNKINHEFWRGKRVFITGHTGFKGGWLSLWLSSLGAKVFGYSLPPESDPNFYSIVNLNQSLSGSIYADVRDATKLISCIQEADPEIVIHMAAQPLVRYSYVNPVETFSTNVMGTVNILEAIRNYPKIKAGLIVTTDKCYENNEWIWGYRENEPMGGRDPYSSSKACAELVTSAYRNSFFSSYLHSTNVPLIASARAGNVIGGGDWSEDRLIPDILRAISNRTTLIVRNPNAVRPWQHVLDPLSGYIKLCEKLYEGEMEIAGAWNFGPNDEDARSVGEVVELLIKGIDKSMCWERDANVGPHEAINLRLDCSKARYQLGWTPTWSLEAAINNIVEWHRAFEDGKDMREITLCQINKFMKAKL